MLSPLFIYYNLSSKIGRDHVHAMLFIQRPIFRHAHVMHLAMFWFHVLELPNGIQTVDR
jgi:hypothetical protein